MLREYLNKIDKTIEKVFSSKSPIVANCTPRNHQYLSVSSDNTSVYSGNSAVNYNDIALHTLAKRAWGFNLTEPNNTL